MSEAFSYNREYDFVRHESLQRVTGRPAHEWDIYILKELLDNALDADEQLWNDDHSQSPSLSIRIEYITLPPPQLQQLVIRVQNAALFPIQHLRDSFTTSQYTSRNAFLKNLSRGALGNALKTLLGIPYALHYRFAGNWIPNLGPLSICCQGINYMPRYHVDSSAQTIDLELREKPCKFSTGTTITVGLNHFVQQIPRTLKDIQSLAQQYRLCNPHATFHWTLDLQGEHWEHSYSARADWSYKFHDLAPVQWYSLSAFNALLGALYRREHSKDTARKLLVKDVCRYFAASTPIEKNDSIIKQVIQASGCTSLTKADIESPIAQTLYTTLVKYSASFQSTRLGAIGQTHVNDVLTDNFQVEGKVHYAIETDQENNPETPFILEAAITFLKEGKRNLWTAINFSPTYNDPFLSCWLQTPEQSEELVLGLRGLLDIYGFTEETPVVLFLHIICPTIEYNEFSKTDINHLPFKKVLGHLLDSLFNALRQQHDEEEIHLERKVFQALDHILDQVKSNERFIIGQLLERLYAQLNQDKDIVLWLQRPGTRNRLRLYILRYQDTSPTFTRFVAHLSQIALYLPSHPNHYVSMPVKHLVTDLSSRYSINKILYIQQQELAPVILDNNWLCRMDMALIYGLADAESLEESIIHCMKQYTLPMLILHDGTHEGYILLERLSSKLDHYHISTEYLIDLQPAQNSQQMIYPMELMTGDLEIWLRQRFSTLDIPLKYLPSPDTVRKDISIRFEQLLLAYLLEDMKRYFALNMLLLEVNKIAPYTKNMIDKRLDEKIKHVLNQRKSSETYQMITDTIVNDLFKEFVGQYGHSVKKQALSWIRQKSGNING